MENDEYRRRYPFKTGRVYLNAISAILLIFLTLMFLREPLLLLYYVILTSILTTILLWLKANPLIRVSKPLPKDTQEIEGKTHSRRRSFSLIVLLVLILALPFFLFLLARFLPPYSWFILIASLASGISFSEIFFYIYCKKWVTHNA